MNPHLKFAAYLFTPPLYWLVVVYLAMGVAGADGGSALMWSLGATVLISLYAWVAFRGILNAAEEILTEKVAREQAEMIRHATEELERKVAEREARDADDRKEGDG